MGTPPLSPGTLGSSRTFIQRAPLYPGSVQGGFKVDLLVPILAGIFTRGPGGGRLVLFMGTKRFVMGIKGLDPGMSGDNYVIKLDGIMEMAM